MSRYVGSHEQQMTGQLPLSRAAKLYIGAVIAAGVTTIALSTFSVITGNGRSDWWVLAALTLLTGSFSLKVPTVSARISVSEAFVFVGLLLFGKDVATLIVALDTLVLTSWLRGPSRSPLRALFNMSAGAVAISAAAALYAQMLPDGIGAQIQLERLILPVVVLASTYFAINSSLIAVALGFERRSSPINIWRRNFAWLVLNYLGGASVALLLYSY